MQTLHILEEPKTFRLDNHTHFFIYATKVTVLAGRQACVLISDIKLPFQKTPITTIQSAVADIQFATSDEFFSEDLEEVRAPSNENIDFSLIAGLGLKIVSKFEMIDAPSWFDSEFEGIVHLEAVMRKFLPPSRCPWTEMSSDLATSHLAFCGVGQLYVTHRTAWEAQRAAPVSERACPVIRTFSVMH